MRKNTQVTSRRARNCTVAPVTRAVRAALAVSAATLALAGQALAAEPADLGHTPSSHVAVFREISLEPVLDLTIAGGEVPSSVIDRAIGSNAFVAERSAIPSALNVTGFGGLEPVDDVSHPMADFVYNNVAPIIVNEVNNPAIGINGQAGYDNVFINNYSLIDVYSAFNTATGIVGNGDYVGIFNAGTILTDGAGSSIGIDANGNGVHIDNNGTIYAYAFGGGAEAIGISANASGYALVHNDAIVISIGDESTAISAHGNGYVDVWNSGVAVAYGGTSAIGMQASSSDKYGVTYAGNGGTVAAYALDFAAGIVAIADGKYATANINNGGTVYVGALGADATAVGLYADGMYGSNIFNSGTVDVYSAGAAFGAFAYSDDGSSVYNTGLISVTGLSTSYGSAGIVSVAAYGSASATNTGSVDVYSMVDPVTAGAGGIGMLASGAYGALANNQGSISVNGLDATGIAAQSSYGFAEAINNGVVVAGDNYTSDAVGISAGGNLGASVYNGNTVIAQGSNSAIGIGVGSAGDASVTNNGLVVAISGYGAAYGIIASGDNVNVTNSGDIIAQGNGTVMGVYMGGNVINFTNDVAISTYSAAGNAWGIYANAGYDAFITNNGSVTVGTGAATGFAVGIDVFAGDYAYVLNAGSITVDTVGATAFGMSVSATEGLVFNDGLIDVYSAGGGAIGINMNGDYAAAVNFGDIYAEGSIAFGMNVNGGYAIAVNLGNITATGSDQSFGLVAYGGDVGYALNAGNVVVGDLLNSDSATGLLAVANNADGAAIGVNYGTIDASSIDSSFGMIVSAGAAGGTAFAFNSGDIYANQSNKYGNGSAGIVASGDVSADVINQGLIQVNSAGAADGIIALSNGDVNVTNGGVIDVLSYYSAYLYSANGIFAQAGGQVSVDNTGDIFVASTYFGGYYTAGINVTGVAGATVNNSGVVVADSWYATGISASSAADASVVNSGYAVAYGGFTATGIEAIANGVATVDNSGMVYAASSFDTAIGIIANGGIEASVLNSGYAIAFGDYAYGVIASSVGSASVDNSGFVLASGGTIGAGLVASGGDLASVVNSGQVIVDGQVAYGIAAFSNTNAIVDQTQAGTIDVGGGSTAVAIGIYAASGGDASVINAGSINAYSIASGSVGIVVDATGAASVDNSGVINAYSFNGQAIGISASGDVTTVTNSGDIFVDGVIDSFGILASGASSVTIDHSGYINAFNYYYDAFGIGAASGGSIDITVTGDIVSNASVASAYGIYAYAVGDVNIDFGGNNDVDALNGLAVGIYAVSGTGNVTIEHGGVSDAFSTYGQAIGIFAAGDNIEVHNSGSIAADGYNWTAGISVNGTNATVINDGDISANVRFDTVNEARGYHYAIGIAANAENVFIGNSGTIEALGDVALGVVAYGLYSVTVDNSGSIVGGDLYSSYSGTGIFANALGAGGTIAITNSGDITGAGEYGGVGIQAIATGSADSSVSVINDGSIYASQWFKYGDGASGIVAISAGDVSVENNGLIEVWSGGDAFGIRAGAIYGDASVSNTGTVYSLSDWSAFKYSANGIVASSVYGTATVDNSGTVIAVSSYGGGYYANGIVAIGGDGASIVNSGDIDALGWYSYGAIASSGNGNASIVNTGNVNASGSSSSAYLAYGLLGITGNGDVSISNENRVYAGAYNTAVGIGSFSGGDSLITNSGEVYAFSDIFAAGIRSIAYNGTATVENSGFVYAGAPNVNAYYYTAALGIDARGDVVSVVNTGDIEAFSYDTGMGVRISALSDASLVNEGNIIGFSLAGLGAGAVVLSDGSITIDNSGDIYGVSLATGYGLAAIAGTDLNFDNSGEIAGYSFSADVNDAAIGAMLLSYGSITGSNSGSIWGYSGGDAEAIGLQLLANGVVDFTNSGVITAFHAYYGVAVDIDAGLAYFENTGSIYVNSAIDGQVAIRGGDATQVILNRGDITGALVLGGGTDVFAGYNGSEWLVNNFTTDFGAGADYLYNFGGSLVHVQDGGIYMGGGNDFVYNFGEIHLENGAIYMGGGTANVFENSGTIRVSGYGLIDMGNGLAIPDGTPDAPLAVPSLNAVPFLNEGIITFLDGAPDDVLAVIGDFGGDGALIIDVGILAGAADLLYVDGSIAGGTNQVVHAEFDGRVTDLLDPVTFAIVTGNTAGNPFVGGIAIGGQSDFLDYHLEVTSAVVGGDTEYRLGVNITGLNTAGSLAAAVSPGAHSLINSHIGNWRQRMGVLPNTDGLNGLGPWVRAWRDSGTLDVGHITSFGPGGNYRFDQDNEGREIGFNFDSGHALSWGIMVGSAEGVQTFGGLGRTRLDMDSGGLYVTWIGDHLYADVSWRGIDFEATMRTPTTTAYTQGDATALSIETGWRGLNFAGIDVVPQLQYTRTEITNIDDVVGLSSSFEYHPGTSERLRLGFEFSRTFDAGAVIWTPYASLNAIREFDGDNGFTVADFHTGVTSTEGTSGMVELGIGAQINGWSITAGASWTDGGAQDSFAGGQVVVRYTW